MERDRPGTEPLGGGCRSERVVGEGRRTGGGWLSPLAGIPRLSRCKHSIPMLCDFSDPKLTNNGGDKREEHNSTRKGC